MKAPSAKPAPRAINTTVSTDHGLDQEFTSLDAQYDAASAYIRSQAHAGWTLIRSRYDDGGYSGGSTDRPDLQDLGRLGLASGSGPAGCFAQAGLRWCGGWRRMNLGGSHDQAQIQAKGCGPLTRPKGQQARIPRAICARGV